MCTHNACTCTHNTHLCAKIRHFSCAHTTHTSVQKQETSPVHTQRTPLCTNKTILMHVHKQDISLHTQKHLDNVAHDIYNKGQISIQQCVSLYMNSFYNLNITSAIAEWIGILIHIKAHTCYTLLVVTTVNRCIHQSHMHAITVPTFNTTFFLAATRF